MKKITLAAQTNKKVFIPSNSRKYAEVSQTPWLVNQAMTRTAALLNVMFTESRIRGKRHKYHKKY